MKADELLDSLLGPKDTFEFALTHVRDAATGDLLVSLLNRLDTHTGLENSERERRLNTVFARVAITAQESLSLAEAGAKVSNVVLRNALTQLLPPEYRSVVFQRRKAAPFEPEQLTTAVSEASGFQGELIVQGLTIAERQAGFSDVIVLSIDDDPATRKLLESAHFVPLRCSSIEALVEMMATNEEICAFLVESSFLASLDQTQQAALISKCAGYSTFAWLRFQDEALIQSNVDVGQLIASARCRTEVTEVSFREKAGVQERELASLRSAQSRLLEGEAHGLFIPGELTRLELKLLGAAMGQYSKYRRFNPRAELTQVTTKFLHGGQTGARVALVKVNDLRVPVIVKLDQKQFILDEARRFLTFIHKDNPDLHPEVHFHAEAALIVFGIIADANAEEERPAPTLEQRLTEYWYEEMRDPMNCDGGETLFEGFTEAAGRLATLNKQKCSDSSFECRANPFIESVKKMESEGFSWGFNSKAIAERGEAEKLLSTAARQAICHGDAHTRNILIRREQGFLIDYALSGPGHPCSDLVKLELSIYLSRFLQFGTEQDLVMLQRALSIERLPLTELLLRHKDLIRSKTNLLCLKMCVSARDLVADVLKVQKLPWEHYLATKLLGAWQALQVPNLQHALARGIVAALSQL